MKTKPTVAAHKPKHASRSLKPSKGQGLRRWNECEKGGAPNTQGIYSLVSGRAEWKLRVKPEMEVRMKRAGLSPVRALIVISPKSFMGLLAVLVMAGLT